MRIKFTPSHASGRVSAPPSKSMAHRALICAALSDKSTVYNVGTSRDVEATLDCLERLGARVERRENCVVLGGLDMSAVRENTELYCHESGSTLRFLIPLCMTGKNDVKITGSERLFERPLGIYEEISREKGIRFEKDKACVTVGGGLTAGEYEVSGEVSSQFITGLFFALSTLDEKSTVTVTGRFESESYVKMTLSVMEHFGVKIERRGRIFTVNPSLCKSCEYTVEGDWSSAAFLEAFNVLSGDVAVEGLFKDTLQGDSVYPEFYKNIKKGYYTYDLTDCPDLAPVTFALAAALSGGEFVGTARLKMKESDRAEAMREELAKLGVEIDVFENRVVIPEGEIHPPSTPISSHNDHRIAMAMSVLLSVVGGELEGAEAVLKSFPDFFEKLTELNIGLEYYA